ncbi:protein FAR1-RELATED SEQUENCE 5-like [Silene latifolia]|uniref:protein FAR1-RELATED SEQUENCE 5-like n=1 Tax=Silene latifolia TaxID=37657 RepID=UPI003D76C7B5
MSVFKHWTVILTGKSVIAKDNFYNIEHNGKQKPNEEEFCKDVEAKFTPYYTTKRWRGGEIKSKLLVYNREGFKQKGQLECSDGQDSGRRHKVGRVGCKARIRSVLDEGELLIDIPHGHNHELVSARDREFQKDVKCYIYERDGQMFVDHFKELAVTRPGFFFDYDVDSDGSLSKAIWADGIARRNYSVFGDAVSFDPTYSTNKYDMSFTPFTGVDNHKRSVTFCGALVAHEDADSFKWVFTRFLGAMGGKEPKYIITDQDAGILKAVPLVFKTARHRYSIEVHGAEVYNHKVFEEFKEEAKCSIGTCKSRGFTECGSLEVTTVRDASRREIMRSHTPDTLKATCSCRMLERKGIICRHVIWIYSSNGVKIIPKQCIVKRWCKDARLSKMFDCNGEATEDIDIIDGKQIAMSMNVVGDSSRLGLLMGKLKNDVENFSCLIRQFKEKLSPLGSPLNKRQQLEKILGCSPARR